MSIIETFEEVAGEGEVNAGRQCESDGVKRIFVDITGGFVQRFPVFQSGPWLRLRNLRHVAD